MKPARCLGALILLVPLGLAAKRYSGPASNWVANSFGGLLYLPLLLGWRFSWRLVSPKLVPV